MNKNEELLKEVLLDEYSALVGENNWVTISGFLNFLVKRIQELEHTRKWARAWKLAAKVNWRLSTDRVKELNARLDRLEALDSQLEGEKLGG